tara:strand:- start:1854 stop:2624 length:771 start_codon:yes stop_codon:yes gene_type:complete
MIKESFIYNGQVIHKRFKPKEHFFRYKVFSLFLDLSEIKFIEKKISFFSYNKFNLISFFDKDHGSRNGSSLSEWVKKNLKRSGLNTKDIKIKLLCYPRILGYVFNPLSIFFVYNSKSSLIAILYEVKNTFGEQHTYVFRTNSSGKKIQNNCEKKFYVSPFMDLSSKYYFKILVSKSKLSVVIDQRDNEGKLLYASQDGIRSELSSRNLILSYMKHPLMTFKIISAIHFEALRLWIKGIKLIKKEKKIKNNITIEAK